MSNTQIETGSLTGSSPTFSARIPDATGPTTPADFLKVLDFQTHATSTATPARRFEECAAEFDLATLMVGRAIPGGT